MMRTPAGTSPRTSLARWPPLKGSHRRPARPDGSFGSSAPVRSTDLALRGQRLRRPGQRGKCRRSRRGEEQHCRATRSRALGVPNRRSTAVPTGRSRPCRYVPGSRRFQADDAGEVLRAVLRAVIVRNTSKLLVSQAIATLLRLCARAEIAPGQFGTKRSQVQILSPRPVFLQFSSRFLGTEFSSCQLCARWLGTCQVALAAISIGSRSAWPHELDRRGQRGCGDPAPRRG